MSLTDRPTAELLALSQQVLAELRRRGVIRSGNAPIGDYAELLVQRSTGGELASGSQKSWDVQTPAGERLQVKARLLIRPETRRGRQLSAFRSWDFDAAIVVLFDGQFRVWRATRLSPEILRASARFTQHVNAWRVIAIDELLAQGEDWTGRLRRAQAEVAAG